ncbi:expressed unknown protein [Seminavis robusta]|uniref:EGF-like domain-containing protein n=1 Tax=Seminavis robusta TaxID=568900 RepID=A0A9N8H8A6_9STRA|nr:expressed unknown protein [Seminavis robusta]|eukprot:Sro163_g073310.1 n/a (967) ;mRNA; f:67933-71346
MKKSRSTGTLNTITISLGVDSAPQLRESHKRRGGPLYRANAHHSYSHVEQHMADDSDESIKLLNYRKQFEDDTLRDAFQDEEGAGDYGAEAEDEDLPVKRLLPDDIYSILYTANLCGRGFVFALMVFLMQSCFLILLAANLYDVTGKPNETNGVENRMNVPAGVEAVVIVAQMMGMFMTVMMMCNNGDFLQGVTQLAEGYDSGLQEVSNNATRARWLATGIARILSGLLFSFLSFVLMMTSKDVLNVFLNLTGLHFLQDIDNIGFQVASLGLIGRQAKLDCEHVQGLTHYTPTELKQRVVNYRLGFIGLLSCAMVGCWGYFAYEQLHRQYVCHHLYIQFGDGIFPHYAYYSGIFTLQKDKMLASARPVYVDATGELRVGWCKAEKTWTIYNTTKDDNSNNDACTFVFKSSKSDSFDVMEVAELTWYVADPGLGEVPVDRLGVFCFDCGNDREYCSEGTFCNQEAKEKKCEKTENPTVGIRNEEAFPSCRLYGADRTTIAGIASSSMASLLREVFRPLDNATKFNGMPIQAVDYFDKLPAGVDIWFSHSEGILHEFSAKGDETWEVLVNAAREYAPEIFNDDGYDVDTTKILEARVVSKFVLFTGRRYVVFGLGEGKVSKLKWADFADWLYRETRTIPQVLNRIRTHEHSKQHLPLFFSSPVDFGKPSYAVEPTSVTWYRAKKSKDPILGYEADESQPLDVSMQCLECDDITDPCRNDQVCISGYDTHSFQGVETFNRCACSPFFDGAKCEYALGCLEMDELCFNGGTCDVTTNTCACKIGFDGNLCQYYHPPPNEPINEIDLAAALDGDGDDDDDNDLLAKYMEGINDSSYARTNKLCLGIERTEGGLYCDCFVEEEDPICRPYESAPEPYCCEDQATCNHCAENGCLDENCVQADAYPDFDQMSQTFQEYCESDGAFFCDQIPPNGSPDVGTSSPSSAESPGLASATEETNSTSTTTTSNSTGRH